LIAFALIDKRDN